jgi:hypothetical protein
VTIFDRRSAVRVVRELTALPERIPSSAVDMGFPALVFEGMRGTGKTALLDDLAELLDQRVPYARVSLESHVDVDIPQVLSALALGLGRRCPLYGALRFPRLVIGLLVTRRDNIDRFAGALAGADRARALREVTTTLKEHRRIDRLVGVLQDTANQALAPALPTPVPAGLLGQVISGLVNGLAGWKASRRYVLGKALAWYGHRDENLTNDAVDVLVDLIDWARVADIDVDSRERRDDLLLAAFRADLWHNFRRRARRKPWMLNCVILLDDADSEVGQDFLKRLVQDRHDAPNARVEPLTIVATSRGALLDGVAAENLAADTYVRHRQQRLGDAAPQWLRYRLDDLTQDTVIRQMAPHVDRRMALAAYQFTGGHPGSTRLILDTEGNDLGSVLSRKTPPRRRPLSQPTGNEGTSDDGPITIAERLCRDLLGISAAEQWVEDLVTCAAARTRDQAEALINGSDLVGNAPGTHNKITESGLWDADSGEYATSGGYVTLCRLLLRRLASRRADKGPAWAEVHGWLRRHCRDAQPPDTIGEMYHALALGCGGEDLRGITEYFKQQLHDPTISAETWLAELRAVSAAPRPIESNLAPDVEVNNRTRELSDPQKPWVSAIARLVVGLWVATDPLTVRGRHDLHVNLAAEFRTVAQFLPNSRRLLNREAVQHDRLAQQWMDRPPGPRSSNQAAAQRNALMRG